MIRQETLSGTSWRFYYDENTFPPGTDTFLLSSFPVLKPGARVCDLGAGSGLLGLLLLRRERTLSVTGVELNGGDCRLAERSIRESGLDGQFRVLNADLRAPEALPRAGSFDLAVCNPPYFSPGSGASAAGAARRNSRSEESCSLSDICRAAARLVRWGGRFCLVYRPERLCDLLSTLRGAGLEPKRLRFVENTAGGAPLLVLAEGRRGGRPGLAVEPPLILCGPDGGPAAELDAIYFRNTEERS